MVFDCTSVAVSIFSVFRLISFLSEYLFFFLFPPVVSDQRDGVETVPVIKGDFVALHTDTAEIQKYHLIQWMFGNTVICTINKTSQAPDINDAKPFLNKLDVDHETGSLKIRSIRTELCGIYNLKMISSTHTIQKRFNITIFGEYFKNYKSQVHSLLL